VTELEKLDPEEIVKTARRLRSRISERFPGAGLVGVSDQLVELASRAKRTCVEIRSPNLRLRVTSYLVISLVIVAAIIGLWLALSGASSGAADRAETIQAIEAGINDVVLLGAAIYFFMHLEIRLKRGRIVKALHELRTLSHLIDVHQLTKSPDIVGDGEDHTTASSPQRSLTPYQLGRYLDYCSEMLSLTGKIAALYGDGFDDAESIEAVNEVEELTIGLQTKIWQKLLLLRMVPTRTPLVRPKARTDDAGSSVERSERPAGAAAEKES
jgi:hypothetical protein